MTAEGSVDSTEKDTERRTWTAGFRHMEINFRAENEIEFVCEYNYINFRFRFVVGSSSLVRAILEGPYPGGANAPVCVSASLYWNWIILFDFLHKPKWCGIWRQTRIRILKPKALTPYSDLGISVFGFGFRNCCRLFISCRKIRIEMLEKRLPSSAMICICHSDHLAVCVVLFSG